jgi:hypothetical protein
MPGGRCDAETCLSVSVGGEVRDGGMRAFTPSRTWNCTESRGVSGEWYGIRGGLRG